MKKMNSNKTHPGNLRNNIDGLGTISIIFGIVCIGFIMYNVLNVIFS